MRGIVRKGERRSIACRKSAILVPAGNPADIRSVEDMAKPGVRVAISIIDCLKGMWEDICGRMGLIDPIRRNITFHANGCIAIVEAVAQGKVEAAFGWTAFEHLAPGRIEVIPLPEDQAILRSTCVGLLEFSHNVEEAKRFMDFLTTGEVRAFYREFGWI